MKISSSLVSKTSLRTYHYEKLLEIYEANVEIYVGTYMESEFEIFWLVLLHNQVSQGDIAGVQTNENEDQDSK